MKFSTRFFSFFLSACTLCNLTFFFFQQHVYAQNTNSTLVMSVRFEGINGKNNATPKHPQRSITLSFYKSTNTNFSGSPDASFLIPFTLLSSDPDGTFMNSSIGVSSIPAGTYYILAKLPGGSLQELMTNGQPITLSANQTSPITIAPVLLRMGDFNDDNSIDITDYNMLIDCYGVKQSSPACVSHMTGYASVLSVDANDDGVVDLIDYNIFIRHFNEKGYGSGSSSVQPTQQIPILLPSQTILSTPTPIPTPMSQSSSGEAMPVGDIPGWHQIFADDFTTNVPLGSFPSAVSSKWDAYPDGWKDTSKNGTYYPSKVVSIQSGVMNLYLHTENGVHMVSAPEPKLPGGVGSEGGLLYGRYVIRFKSDLVPGYKTAWLLWPDSETWPRDGEIDFPEGDVNGNISAFMHRQNGTSGSDQDAYSTTATYTSWHTAVIEWSPTQTNFILDSNIIGTSTNRIPNTPMHWVIQTETSLNGSPPSNTTSGNVQIDWVAVYTPVSS